MTINTLLAATAAHFARPSAPARPASTPRTNTVHGTSESPASQAANPITDRVELSRTAQAHASRTERTPEEQAQIDELKQRDTEVRQHEAAHLAAAGGYARGGANYEYQTGPDGRQYAVGGEVQIDTAPVPNDPEATIQKMQTVRAAALAPAEPSAQDRRVAAAAAAEIQAARAKLSENKSEDKTKSTPTPTTYSARGTGNTPPSPRHTLNVYA